MSIDGDGDRDGMVRYDVRYVIYDMRVNECMYLSTASFGDGDDISATQSDGPALGLW